MLIQVTRLGLWIPIKSFFFAQFVKIQYWSFLYFQLCWSVLGGVKSMQLYMQKPACLLLQQDKFKSHYSFVSWILRDYYKMLKHIRFNKFLLNPTLGVWLVWPFFRLSSTSMTVTVTIFFFCVEIELRPIETQFTCSTFSSTNKAWRGFFFLGNGCPSSTYPYFFLLLFLFAVVGMNGSPERSPSTKPESALSPYTGKTLHE